MPVKSPPRIESFTSNVKTLGPWQGRYTPAYEVIWYREGNPAKVIHGEFDTRSVVSIETSKNISNVAGTWTIVLKDARVEHAVASMDVAVIKLKGHNESMQVVLKGVVDEVGKEDSAEPESAQENTVITGRCMAKYMQVNSLFLPVWEPLGLLPTALTFGLGDSSQKAGTNISATVPKEIFGYVYRRYIVGSSKHVGISGTPMAAHWLNKDKRFEKVKVRETGGKAGEAYRVPYIQFDEDTCDKVLEGLCITGFTEGWVDEEGNVVYRPPGWDLPVSYILPTGGLISDKFGGSDVGMATYVEVVPSGAIGISTAAQQATAAGRAPMPSNYLAGIAGSSSTGVPFVSKEFVIDANGKGEVTKRGQKNYWYRRQRKYGLRPYQVTSPLLVSQAQAQAQAEGLLKFLGNRLQKTGTVTIPGEPGIKLGTTILIRGTLRGKAIERTFFIEGVNHEYVDGQGYKTTLELTHGRDPWDPEFERMVLPANPSSAQLLAEAGGVSNPSETPVSPEVNSTVNSAGYANPFQHVQGLVPERRDMGVDYAGKGPIVAMGDAQVTFAENSTGWEGGGCVVIKLLNGAYAGKSIYVAEELTCSVQTGQHVKAGQVLCELNGGCEYGWASGEADEALAAHLGQQKPTGDPGGWESASGASMNRLLVSTGCVSGTKNTGGGPHGTMPAGYP